MIIWIASYPKSGNTWIRLFLNSLIYSDNSSIDINDIKIRLFPIRKDFESLSENINDVNELIRNCLYSQIRLNLDKSVKIFKSHNALWQSQNYKFTNEENTLATVYIVRDPRNIITSIKNHYIFENYDTSLKFMTDDKQTIGIKKNAKLEIDLPTIISSWKNHYNSWKKLKRKYLLIKYENLLNKPLEEFTKITKFLENISDFRFEEKKILRSIENCNFKNLKTQEYSKGFKEAPVNNLGKPIKFFNLGPDNNWEKLLDPKTVDKLENIFGDEMKELGYL
jgi:hypothetical protein|tara:strand:+ start:3355 stop:4194 length:840 start_codon:yes stop_codon:yes gene_type:complete